MSESRRRSLTRLQIGKLYAITLAAEVALDLAWLGFVAKGFYARHIGQLMRADVMWAPAVAFYLLYAAALVAFVIMPAVRRRSWRWAVVRGAFFGAASYACFDLVGLALLKDFPATIALVDLAWGALLAATACGAAFFVAGRSLID